MLLRALVIALFAANLGFYAWTAGWLDGVVGGSGRSEREPERLLRQVRPETIRVIPPGAALPAPAPASAAAPTSACLQSATMTAAQATAADAALRRVQPPLPERSWLDTEIPAPPGGGWLVYMGRFAGADALTKKEDELRRRHIDFEVVQPPGPLAPGLALGRYDDRPAAEEALSALARQDVHTARVVQASAPATAHVLRFGHVDALTAAQLAGLQSEAYGGGFVPCPPTTAASTNSADAAR